MDQENEQLRKRIQELETQVQAERNKANAKHQVISEKELTGIAYRFALKFAREVSDVEQYTMYIFNQAWRACEQHGTRAPVCADCDGQGWVCEDHPEVPFNSGEGCCGGAGMKCKCQRTPVMPTKKQFILWLATNSTPPHYEAVYDWIKAKWGGK